MFGRDPVILLNSFLKLTVRYLGTDENMLSSEALKNMYQMVATNLELARKKRNTEAPVPDKKLKDGESVLIRGYAAYVWDASYTGDYRIVSFPRKMWGEVVDSMGKQKYTYFQCETYILPIDTHFEITIL